MIEATPSGRAYTGEKAPGRTGSGRLSNERAKNPDQKEDTGKTAPHLQDIPGTTSSDFTHLSGGSTVLLRTRQGHGRPPRGCLCGIGLAGRGGNTGDRACRRLGRRVLSACQIGKSKRLGRGDVLGGSRSGAGGQHTCCDGVGHAMQGNGVHGLGLVSSQPVASRSVVVSGVNVSWPDDGEDVSGRPRGRFDDFADSNTEVLVQHEDFTTSDSSTVDIDVDGITGSLVEFDHGIG